MNVDTLKAGRELDALVAEKVMGWKECTVEAGITGQAALGSIGAWYWIDEGGRKMIEGYVKPYSKNIAAAWEVVEKLLESGESVAVRQGQIPSGMIRQCCIGFREGVEAETVPLAICRAALVAVGA